MKSSIAIRICLVLALMGAAAPASNSQEPLQQWENFDFANMALKRTDIANLPLNDLKLLRGIIFGRHGRIFKDAEIRSYLQGRSWYKGSTEFQNALLNKLERQNLDLIRDAEASKHESVQPGDMRYWRTRLLSKRRLGRHSGAEWKVLSAEIEAIHGKRFDDEPWLQQYFEERYWYSAAQHYDPKQLTETERGNLQTIAAAQKKQRRVALAPGDMELFENKPISEALLHGLSLYELRLLRNEIYARHGRSFRAPWLAQYFFNQSWYAPDENFKDEELSGSDKQNVEVIVKYENRIHEQLGTKPITRTLLEGLFVEDAAKMRQEIYARRGKVFKEPWLQQYFATFDWYKANPDFNEASFTPIEKRNIDIIAAYEKRAVSAMSVIEG